MGKVVIDNDNFGRVQEILCFGGGECHFSSIFFLPELYLIDYVVTSYSIVK